ncbi:MAG: DEAD/DEAH box helicase [candidate division Zixibacteria bacterium]|nr:DEAD/DEAH box helicase [candidate division Zixibacteria bacterium]
MIATPIAEAVVRAIIQLRDYQQKAYDDIQSAWSSGHRNVLAVLPTGAGKTVLFSKIILDHGGASCAVAHRQELVSQISLALARNGVRHRIIGPDKIIRSIVRMQLTEFGRSFYDPSARCAVAGVDTLVRRGESLKQWLNSVTLWVIDECHHVLKANKWGKCCDMFPNARGLGVTATPCRADGAGLGRHHDGLMDVMIQGPTMRELINRGFLTEYRVIAPPSDLDLSTINISKSTGDYNQNQMRDAVAHSSLIAHDDGKSRVIGDVVKHYQRFASGKLGVTFVPTVDIANDVVAEFNAVGVPAEVVSAKTPDAERVNALRRFKNRDVMNLVNVDLFGEGFDLPAIEVVSMARPTQSYSLYVQQFGRALRVLDGKTRAIIIDHVGNVARHKLPDAPCEWSLDRRDKRSSGKSDAIPTRTCSNEECFAVYERHRNACPYCGTTIPEPTERGGPEFVDGDLFELDAETLARMRGEINRVEEDVTVAANQYRADLIGKHCPTMAVIGNTKKFIAKHNLTQQANTALRECFAIWAGYRRAEGLADSEIYRMFYFQNGIDYMTALTLPSDTSTVIADKLLMEC